MLVSLSIVQLLFYHIALLVIFYQFYKKKIKSKIAILIGLIFFIFIILCSIVFEHNIFLIIYILSPIIQMFVVKFSIEKIENISITGVYAFLYSINLIISVLTNCIIHILGIEHLYMYFDFFTYLVTLLILIICSINVKISNKIYQTLKILPTKIKALTVVSFFTSGIIMTMVISNPLLNENSPWSISLRISIVLLAVFLCITFPLVILMAMTNEYLKKQNKNFEEKLDAQAEYYSKLALSNFELRRFRHDFNNMQIGLKRNIEENNIQEALVMLEEERQNLYKATDQIISYDTGNGIVDAILMDKQQKSAHKNISINFSGYVPSGGLSSTDLCIIFGNTLDNAVEACERLPSDAQKTVTVSSQCSSGFAFITISNPVSDDVPIKNGRIETTKEDSSLHGYGLYSLRQTVKKYDGELKLSSENKTFTVNIELTLM